MSELIGRNKTDGPIAYFGDTHRMVLGLAELHGKLPDDNSDKEATYKILVENIMASAAAFGELARHTLQTAQNTDAALDALAAAFLQASGDLFKFNKSDTMPLSIEEVRAMLASALEDSDDIDSAAWRMAGHYQDDTMITLGIDPSIS